MLDGTPSRSKIGGRQRTLSERRRIGRFRGCGAGWAGWEAAGPPTGRAGGRSGLHRGGIWRYSRWRRCVRCPPFLSQVLLRHLRPLVPSTFVGYDCMTNGAKTQWPKPSVLTVGVYRRVCSSRPCLVGGSAPGCGSGSRLLRGHPGAQDWVQGTAEQVLPVAGPWGSGRSPNRAGVFVAPLRPQTSATASHCPARSRGDDVDC